MGSGRWRAYTAASDRQTLTRCGSGVQHEEAHERDSCEGREWQPADERQAHEKGNDEPQQQRVAQLHTHGYNGRGQLQHVQQLIVYTVHKTAESTVTTANAHHDADVAHLVEVRGKRLGLVGPHDCRYEDEQLRRHRRRCQQAAYSAAHVSISGTSPIIQTP